MDAMLLPVVGQTGGDGHQGRVYCAVYAHKRIGSIFQGDGFKAFCNK